MINVANMKDTYYFWLNGKVVEVERGKLNNDRELDNQVTYCHCVDGGYSPREPQMRYGRFNGRGWEHIPFEDLNKEFRFSLFLQGITE